MDQDFLRLFLQSLIFQKSSKIWLIHYFSLGMGTFPPTIAPILLNQIDFRVVANLPKYDPCHQIGHLG